MKLVVFGATGGTGKQLVARGLDAGHDVIAVARKPEAVTTRHERLRVVQGDVLEPASVERAVAGGEAVLSAIGPANNKQPGTLISEGIQHMIAACEKTGVRRLVFESGLMVGDGTGLGLVSKVGVAIYRSMYKALCADKRIAEAALRASSLDYVIVRPPALADGPATARYRSGVDIPINAARKMAHADVADFMVKAAADPALARTIQVIGH
jgi:putative NADH-flavin reductase